MPAANAILLLGGYLLGRLRGRPVLTSMVIQPTFRCNLRCLYCNSPGLAGEELDLQSWRRILAEARNLGCRRIAIHGGEPLLRDDIEALIETVKRHGMACVLTSNGLLVPQRVETLVRLDTLVLSLDAPGAGNDRVRGKGVFAQVCAAIDAARHAGIPVKLNAVLSGDTIRELEELIHFAESHDLSLTVNVIRSGNDVLWHQASAIRPDEAELRRALARLSQVARHNARLLFSSRSYDFAARWPDYSVDRVEHADADERWRQAVARAPACHAGRAYLVVAPNGDVAPCPLTADRKPTGNAKRDGLERAWRSLRQHRCLACFSPCMVEQNSLYSLHLAALAHHARRHLPHFA